MEAEAKPVVTAVFKAIRAPGTAFARYRTKPVQKRVEQMRAQVGQNAAPLVPPRRVAHVARSPVSIEHTDRVDSAQSARIQGLLQPYKMRLKTMVIGRVADGVVPLFQLLE